MRSFFMAQLQALGLNYGLWRHAFTFAAIMGLMGMRKWFYLFVFVAATSA